MKVWSWVNSKNCLYKFCKIIQNYPLGNHSIYWYRYVDDIICCYNRTGKQLGVEINKADSKDIDIETISIT